MAEGAVSYYLDKFIVSRIVRYTYGTPASIRYDPSDPEHRRRADKKYLGITGGVLLDVFSPTLFKVDVFVFGSHLGTEPTARALEYPVRKSSVTKSQVLAYSLRSSARPWSFLSSVTQAHRRTPNGWMRMKVGEPNQDPCRTIASEK